MSLPAPIVFTPPAGALGTAVLEGVTSAVLEDGRVVVKGPLPSGPTSVQFGYRLPSDTGRAAITQAFPVGGPMSSVIVRRHAGTTVVVAGERQRRDTQLEGRDYVLVSTGAIQPATPLDRDDQRHAVAASLAGPPRPDAGRADRARRDRVRARPRRRRRHRPSPRPFMTLAG